MFHQFFAWWRRMIAQATLDGIKDAADIVERTFPNDELPALEFERESLPVPEETKPANGSPATPKRRKQAAR